MDWALDAEAFKEWILGIDSAPAWKRIETLREKGLLRFWISAVTVPPLQLWLQQVSSNLDAAAKAPCLGVWEKVRIFTVEAQSVLEALAGGDGILEARIALANFNRIAPMGMFISRLTDLAVGSIQVRTPEAAIENLENEMFVGPNRIPMLDLQAEYRNLLPEIDATLLRTAADAQYISGPLVTRFEHALGAYLGTQHVIGVSSGTESLVLGLRALALTRFGKERFDASDRIITTPFTFVATGDAILRSGATPVFVDIDPVTLNLDTNAVRRYLEDSNGQDGFRNVGIVPVHLFGQSCPMEGLLNLASDYNLFVFEDVAQAMGASWQGRMLGTLGDIGSFSFFPSKNLGSFGDAGAVVTDKSDLAEAVRWLVKHGSKEKNRFDILGYNARLDSLQAGVLLAKLPHLDENNRLRMTIAKRYINAFEKIPGLVVPMLEATDGSRSVFHQFTIRTQRRGELQKHLEAKGISSMLYYPSPLHRMPLFQGRQIVAPAVAAGAGFEGELKSGTRVGLPQAEKAANEVLSLPMGPSMSDKDVDAVIAAVCGYLC